MVANASSLTGLLPGVMRLSPEHRRDLNEFLGRVAWPGNTEKLLDSLYGQRPCLWGGFSSKRHAEQLLCVAHYDVEDGKTAKIILGSTTTEMKGTPKDFGVVDERRNQMEQLFRMGLGYLDKRGRDNVQIRIPAENIILSMMMQNLGMAGRASIRQPGTTLIDTTRGALREIFRRRALLRPPHAKPQPPTSPTSTQTLQPDAERPAELSPSQGNCSTPQSEGSSLARETLFELV